ncbi:hypothetical protein SAMN05443144_10585 [Fodinibius roseus]|uniref:Alpha-L-rhamnosidase six-hairpin glycosidase domain-containing protein n=1 Tax=Fodinibius roseus TaxID=1194090 RepID=A0A1M4YJY5_9BACT|nr:hypothetical protein [Fodinibius roseus]SHF06050.1 hypothetical protein SAMN05443144_10585 [Fodinibius roseus]
MIKTTWFLVLLLLLQWTGINAQSFEDSAYPQPVSKKYAVRETDGDLRMKKMVIDRDDNVFALTNQGLFVIIEDQLVPDRRYRPLADKNPVDITIQSGTGILYYLYDDHYLSNAHAGKPYGSFASQEYTDIAVNESGDVLLAGDKHIALDTNRGRETGTLEEPIRAIKSHGDDFFLQTGTGIHRYENGQARQVVEDAHIMDWTFGGEALFVSNEKGYYAVSAESWEEKESLRTKIPVIPATSLAYREGRLWAGSDIGMYATQNLEDYRYYASRRWLQDDRVLDVAVDSEGNAYALTEQGISEVHFKEMTLKDKADYFYDRIRKRHLRYGLIGEVRMSEPGDLTTMEMHDTDNDGLWTSFYLGSEVFRYAATGAEEAKEHALESFEAFERLISINPLEGFPARTFERKGYRVSGGPEDWRPGVDEKWEWKGTTSSDEFVAYIWVAGIINQYLDLTAREEDRVARFIDQIMSHIIDNDYYFVDIDGEPTLWGRWNPEYVNWYPETVVDRKLGSTTITAGLQLAYKLTGKEIYKEEMQRLFEEHGYLDNIKIPLEKIGPTPGYIYKGHDMGDGGWNHSDDEMAFLTYWVLYHYALNDELQQTYAEVITDHWDIEKPERNALWNLITYGTSGDIDLSSVQWHLREFQLDMIRWDVKNSHRKDLEFLEPNFRGQTTRELLPPGERETHRHNANPFDLDEGNGGLRSLAGDEYLLPYWMGRYLDVIVPVTNAKH